MSHFNGKNVLITGGASGIGKIMGRLSLEKGANTLIIWDINEKNIEATIQELQSLGTVKGYVVDVTNEEQVKSTYQQVKSEIGEVNVLINNAGIIRGNRTFDKQTTQDIRLTFEVNTIAPMLLTLQVLPDMLQRNEGHIVNIASQAGMISNPTISVYAASKWAVIGWSDSVRIEVQEAKSAVKITTVAPYYINTGMFEGVQSRIFPILEPEKTAKKIVRAVEKDSYFCGIPWSFHFVRFMQAILPTCVFDWFFGKVFGIYGAMKNFTGRK